MRLQSIKRLRAAPAVAKGEAVAVDCLGGRAKWMPGSQILSIRVHIVSDNGTDEHFAKLLRDER